MTSMSLGRVRGSRERKRGRSVYLIRVKSIARSFHVDPRKIDQRISSKFFVQFTYSRLISRSSIFNHEMVGHFTRTFLFSLNFTLYIFTFAQSSGEFFTHLRCSKFLAQYSSSGRWRRYLLEWQQNMLIIYFTARGMLHFSDRWVPFHFIRFLRWSFVSSK